MVEQLNQDLDEEMLEHLVTGVVEDTLEKYEIKKAPQNSSLEACLEAYTKEKLLNLADDNDLDAKKSWKKAQIVNYLKDGIMETLEERYLILGERKLELLQQFGQGQFQPNEMTHEEAEFYVSVYSAAVRMGFLYSVKTAEEMTMTMPTEIKETLDKHLSNFKQIEKENDPQMKAWAQIDEVLKAGVNLYGVLTSNEVVDLWKFRHPDSKRTAGETEAFSKYIFEILPLLVLNNGYYFIERHIIASSQFTNEEEATDFYQNRSAKMNNDYYKPTGQEIQYYAEHSFERRILAYKKLKQFISRIAVDTDMVMELIENNITMDENIEDFMKEVADLELVQFGTKIQKNQFKNLYMQLHNDSRLWKNAGYTPTELVKWATTPANLSGELSPFDSNQGEKTTDNIYSFASYYETKKEQQQPIRVKKVGRNEPCPCGSGKKYKKCCMRKSN